MSAAPERVLTRQGVVIALDPHKASWTAVVVTADLAAADSIRVEVNRAGYRQLRRFAAAWPDARWAIEGAVGLGAPLTERLRDDQIAVTDVPAKLARRVRLLSTGHGRKSDQADAVSVGIAVWSAPALQTVQIDAAIAALPAVTEHRDDMVRTRTQLINRLHAVMVKLIPSGLARGLTADGAAEALGRVRPRDPLARTLPTIAVDLVAELRRLNRRIGEATKTLSDAVTTSGTTLTKLLGIGRRGGRQNAGPHRPHQPVPDVGNLRLLLRRRPDRGLLRRRRAPPALPSRRPATELRPPHHGAISDPIRITRPRLLPAQTRRRKEPQRSHALPETAPRRRRLPHHDQRHGFLSVASRLTQRGAVRSTVPKEATSTSTSSWAPVVAP